MTATVVPKGINIKESDSIVGEGLLKESINMQWRDGSLRPMPERILSNINPTNYEKIIFHRIGDEGQINVLGFNSNLAPLFLAFDIAEYLAAGDEFDGLLTWFGTIKNGVYTENAIKYTYDIAKTPGMSFTILNGILYFMGSGKSSAERYYKRLQYNESSNVYELKDMYAWKSLIPFVPELGTIVVETAKKTNTLQAWCGTVLFRYTLVLKTGEEVLHSPIYSSMMIGIINSDDAISVGDVATNIHTIIPLNLEFADPALFDEEISAINVYAAVPRYKSEITEITDALKLGVCISSAEMKSDVASAADEPFYLVKTIDKPSEEKLVLYVGSLSSSFSIDGEYSTVNANTIAAGEIMPEDDFSHHQLFGEISSWNGRLVVKSPTTVLTSGYMRALATEEGAAIQGYIIDTEDGSFTGIPVEIDKAFNFYNSDQNFESRGLFSYPDRRANTAGISISNTGSESLYSKTLRKSLLHNMALSFDFSAPGFGYVGHAPAGDKIAWTLIYDNNFGYQHNGNVISQTGSGRTDKYTSENRFQFSSPGEFSVFPVENSYRVDDAIVALGNNNVDPKNTDLTAPLIVGTSGGFHTVNFDQSGQLLISNITPASKYPFISSRVLQIDQALVFVSDSGLMVTEGGSAPISLTDEFFPSYGDGNFPVNETVFPGYNNLVVDFFGGANPYLLDDVVRYMKGAIFAYDSRRKNIWCSNIAYNFSMVYNITSRQWTFNTLVFRDVMDYYSLVNTGDDDVFTRFMVRNNAGGNLVILSGEDMDTEVNFHMMTRAIKFGQKVANKYKQINAASTRCLIVRKPGSADAYFALGVWGKQDTNKYKTSIPITLKKDDRDEVFPGDVRNDMPITSRKGKYKSIVVLITGKALPETGIDGFEFEVYFVDDSKLR